MCKIGVLILYIRLYRPLREDGHLSLKHAAGFMLRYNLYFYCVLMLVYINDHQPCSSRYLPPFSGI